MRMRGQAGKIFMENMRRGGQANHFKRSIYFINLSDSNNYFDHIEELDNVLNSFKSDGAILIFFTTTDVALPIDFDQQVLIINVDGDFKFNQIKHNTSGST